VTDGPASDGVTRPNDEETPAGGRSVEETELETRPEETAAESAEPAGEAATTGEDGDIGPGSPQVAHLERECDVAADYLEELLDIADLDGDLDLYVEGDRAAVSVVGAGLDQLVGRDGEVLEALQELTRLAVLRETGDRSRLMLDIGGFRANRRKTLEEQAREVVAEVKESGEAQKLQPMTPFERKVVHDAVAAAGLKSESEGEEPRRCVVVLPA
jgi:spoIIIJ-associated protein